MLNVVLVQPEIPSNTGNIARTCVAMNCHLHLVHPLGFSIDDKQVRRAGLDYWQHLKLTTYNSWLDFTEKNAESAHKRVYFTTKSSNEYYAYLFSEDSWLVFGPETRGLDAQLIKDNLDQSVRIPMVGAVRSLNLSNAVAIGVYEAFRQVNKR